jgi:crossover junction endodeoxyribonuclease RusA
VTITFAVHGLPKGQPRARARVAGKHARVYHPKNGPDANWRSDVYTAALSHRPPVPLDGPVALAMRFFLPRPKSHFGSGRNAGIVKSSAPTIPITKPDLDNLVKLVMDVLTDLGYWRDDCQVTVLRASKGYSDRTGCFVNLSDDGRV